MSSTDSNPTVIGVPQGEVTRLDDLEDTPIGTDNTPTSGDDTKIKPSRLFSPSLPDTPPATIRDTGVTGKGYIRDQELSPLEYPPAMEEVPMDIGKYGAISDPTTRNDWDVIQSSPQQSFQQHTSLLQGVDQISVHTKGGTDGISSMDGGKQLQEPSIASSGRQIMSCNTVRRTQVPQSEPRTRGIASEESSAAHSSSRASSGGLHWATGNQDMPLAHMDRRMVEDGRQAYRPPVANQTSRPTGSISYPDPLYRQNQQPSTHSDKYGRSIRKDMLDYYKQPDDGRRYRHKSIGHIDPYKQDSKTSRYQHPDDTGVTAISKRD